MIESVIVNEWKAQAAMKSKIEDVIEFLEVRFGPVSADAKEKIEATTSLEDLRRLVTLAATAACLEKFRKAAGV